jgi:hypothetical protein
VNTGIGLKVNAWIGMVNAQIGIVNTLIGHREQATLPHRRSGRLRQSDAEWFGGPAAPYRNRFTADAYESIKVTAGEAWWIRTSLLVLTSPPWTPRRLLLEPPGGETAVMGTVGMKMGIGRAIVR